MRVTIVKRYEREFRLPLYRLLKEKLESSAIEFELIIGQPNKYEKINIKDALRENSFGPIVHNNYFFLGKKFLSFQNVINQLRKTDLVIVQQSNSELLNYILLIKRNLFRNFKLAFWGHGINFQARNKDSISQKFKLFLSQYVDHWFAYNKLTADIINSKGFPSEKTTILNNTIDVTNEKYHYDQISEIELNSIREKFGIGKEDKVGIFCGSLYKLKRIDFLIESVKLIKQGCSNFHFFILGNGELDHEVKIFESLNPDWFHFIGFKSGVEKQIYLKLSDFQLMPGGVGLNIIDSFYSQTPLITIKDAGHGPEIFYLENGINGVVTDDDLKAYVNNVLELINDADKLKGLKNGCFESFNKYTIENMAENFYRGIIKALGEN